MNKIPQCERKQMESGQREEDTRKTIEKRNPLAKRNKAKEKMQK